MFRGINYTEYVLSIVSNDSINYDKILPKQEGFLMLMLKNLYCFTVFNKNIDNIVRYLLDKEYSITNAEKLALCKEDKKYLTIFNIKEDKSFYDYVVHSLGKNYTLELAKILYEDFEIFVPIKSYWVNKATDKSIFMWFISIGKEVNCEDFKKTMPIFFNSSLQYDTTENKEYLEKVCGKCQDLDCVYKRHCLMYQSQKSNVPLNVYNARTEIDIVGDLSKQKKFCVIFEKRYSYSSNKLRRECFEILEVTQIKEAYLIDRLAHYVHDYRRKYVHSLQEIDEIINTLGKHIVVLDRANQCISCEQVSIEACINCIKI